MSDSTPAPGPARKKLCSEEKAQWFMPSGTASFVKTINEKRFFADKSPMIPRVEQAGKNILFCRPRRFGKSLALDMLMEYHDIKNAAPEKFDELFGSLWIGRKDGDRYLNKTKEQGRYIILKVNFCAVPVPTEWRRGADHVADFERHIIREIEYCAHRYGLELGSVPDTPATALDLLASAAGDTPVYVFIDEYDTPITKLVRSFLTPEEKREDLPLLQRSYCAFLRSILTHHFRLFITGIMGLCISGSLGITFTDTTFDPAWHSFAGYTEDDIKDLLAGIRARLAEDDPCFNLSQGDSVLDRLREAFNGYWFADADCGQTKIYNSQMVNEHINFTLSRQHFPCEEEACSMAHQVFYSFFKFATSFPLVAGKFLVPHNGPITLAEPLSAPIKVDNIMDIYFNFDQAKETLLKILYYHGALTTRSVGQDGKDLALGFPNKAIRQEYLSCLISEIPSRVREVRSLYEPWT